MASPIGVAPIDVADLMDVAQTRCACAYALKDHEKKVHAIDQDVGHLNQGQGSGFNAAFFKFDLE